MQHEDILIFAFAGAYLCNVSVAFGSLVSIRDFCAPSVAEVIFCDVRSTAIVHFDGCGGRGFSVTSIDLSAFQRARSFSIQDEFSYMWRVGIVKRFAVEIELVLIEICSSPFL